MQHGENIPVMQPDLLHAFNHPHRVIKSKRTPWAAIVTPKEDRWPYVAIRTLGRPDSCPAAVCARRLPAITSALKEGDVRSRGELGQSQA